MAKHMDEIKKKVKKGKFGLNKKEVCLPGTKMFGSKKEKFLD
jgi:hypothetical protein